MKRIAIVLAAAILAGCASRNEKRSLAQQLKEDSTLLAQLGSYESSEHNEGIARIKALGKSEGTQLILYLLNEPTIDNYRVEVVLSRILADWKDPRAIGYLLQNIKSQDDGAVRVAAEGLLVFEDSPHVIDAMKEMIDSPQPRERYIAADFLSKMRSTGVLEIVAPRLKTEPDREVRALLLLSVLKSRDATRRQEILIDALVDADLAIRELAWAELKKYRNLPAVSYAPDAAIEVRAEGVAQLRMWRREKQ